MRNNLMPLHKYVTTLFFALVCALSTPAGAQDFKDTFNLRNLGAPKTEIIKFEFDPETAAVGDIVKLQVQVTLPPKAYIYSTSDAFGGATQFEFDELEGLAPVGKVQADHAPKVVFVEDFDQDVEKFFVRVVWTQEFRVVPGATSAKVTGLMRYQVCDDFACRPSKKSFEVSLASIAETATASEEPTQPKIPPEFEVKPGKKEKPLTLKGRLVAKDTKPGSEVLLELTAILEPGWHTYSITQPPENAAEATDIELYDVQGLEPLDDRFLPNPPPEIVHPLEDIVQEVHHDRVTWTRRFQIAEGVKPADIAVTGSFLSQACTEERCLLPTSVDFELGNLVIALRDPIAGTEPTVESPDNLEEPEIAAAAPAFGDDDPRSQGLIYVLGLAAMAGFGALFTPCVFPMVPITVSFFLKQSEKEHHRPVTMALVYCLAIIGTFTFLGLIMSALFGATAVTQLANSVFVNLFLAAVLIFFALNLLGMFEIRIPSWLLTYTAGKESAGGYLGVIFMALTFTLTSFTCTFAFLGLILVWSAQGEIWWPIVALVAFSTAFSLPFFLLALFPSFLQKLPKSGGWMNRVKVVMGMIELAFVFKFLSVADVTWNNQPTLLDYHMVMSAWMVLSVCTGLYLLGVFRLPHDMPSEHVGALTCIVAMSFLGLGSYLAVGLFGDEEPTGPMWENIAAFAPPVFESEPLPAMMVAGSRSADAPTTNNGPYLIGKHDHLMYLLDFDEGVTKAQADGLPLFLDFTGVNCINCRKMERKMAAPHIQERLQKLVRLQLYTDTVPTVTDDAVRAELKKKNLELQEQWFGDTTLPGYAVVSSDGKTVLARYTGLEQEEGTFAAFLDEGLAAWENSKKTATAARPVAASR